MLWILGSEDATFAAKQFATSWYGTSWHASSAGFARRARYPLWAATFPLTT